MNITTFPSGPFQTNAYIVSCPITKQAAIIDPAPSSAQALTAYLNQHQLHLDKILLTHSHWDHIADVATLLKNFDVPVYIHPYDAPNLMQPGSDGLPYWVAFEGVKNHLPLQEGQVIPIGNSNWQVIETPGHTPGGVCFYNNADHQLISGDTLFSGSIGNLSFPTARPHLMWSSLKKLAALPSHTIVYPGHGPATQIAAEPWLNRAEEIFGND